MVPPPVWLRFSDSALRDHSRRFGVGTLPLPGPKAHTEEAGCDALGSLGKACSGLQTGPHLLGAELAQASCVCLLVDYM